MSNYLVTGAAGFIGSKVCQLLLEQGHRVVALDNLSSPAPELQKWRLAQLEGRSRFQFHRVDIRHRAPLAQLFDSEEDLDGVIHLAARAGVRPSLKTPGIYFEANLMGTLNLLEECADHSIQKFVQASSSSVYGEGETQPLEEGMPANRPLSPYAASKQAAEALCYSFHKNRGIDLSVLRFFTVYGPAGRPDMSPFRFCQWIHSGQPLTVYGDGSQSRDFTYIDDIARGTILALKPLGFEIINLGSEHPIVLLDVIRAIEELTGKAADLRFQPHQKGDVSHTWANIEKAKDLLGWRPQWSFRQGLESLLDWYRQNETWASRINTDD